MDITFPKNLVNQTKRSDSREGIGHCCENTIRKITAVSVYFSLLMIAEKLAARQKKLMTIK